jgi:hypothetical protein
MKAMVVSKYLLRWGYNAKIVMYCVKLYSLVSFPLIAGYNYPDSPLRPRTTDRPAAAVGMKSECVSILLLSPTY